MPETVSKRVERLRRFRAERPDLNRAKNAAYKKANPEKIWAHKQVEVAVKAGKLLRQPCERCGSDQPVHAHHDDYAKPLEVMWLCPLHHRERHREIGGSAVCSDHSVRSERRQRPGRCIYLNHQHYRVQFDIGGKTIGVGCFASFEEAVAARDAALPWAREAQKAARVARQRHPETDRPALLSLKSLSVAGDETGAINDGSVGHFVQDFGAPHVSCG